MILEKELENLTKDLLDKKEQSTKNEIKNQIN